MEGGFHHIERSLNYRKGILHHTEERLHYMEGESASYEGECASYLKESTSYRGESAYKRVLIKKDGVSYFTYRMFFAFISIDVFC